MNYWITTHYPHGVPDRTPWDIYFRREPSSVPQPGDLVLFYETEEPPSGHDMTGRKAVVCAAVVAGKLEPISGNGPWTLHIRCRNHRYKGEVPLKAARKHIPGPFYRQTLRQLTEKQYRSVAEEMGVWP